MFDNALRTATTDDLHTVRERYRRALKRATDPVQRRAMEVRIGAISGELLQRP